MSAFSRRREALKRVSHETAQAVRITQLAAMEASVPARGYPQDCIDLADLIANEEWEAVFGPLCEHQRRMVASRMPWQELTLPNGKSRADWDLNAGARFAARRAANAATAEAA